MPDLPSAALELVELARSPHPLHRALLDLYERGEINIADTRNGQILWQIPTPNETDG